MSTVDGSSPWKLSGTKAELRLGPSPSVIDLAAPSRGLHEIFCCGHLVPQMKLLGIGIQLSDLNELALPETYVRGNDLIATYLQIPERAFRTQAYWRVVDTIDSAIPREAVVVELQVSINTTLLDGAPSIGVTTMLPAGATAATSADGILLRPAGVDWSYLELAHPDDRDTVRSITHGDLTRLTYSLFGRPLEKGVIMRSRIRGVLLPRAGDAEAAEAIIADFAQSRPPLTT